jgi:hypothetical protein
MRMRRGCQAKRASNIKVTGKAAATAIRGRADALGPNTSIIPSTQAELERRVADHDDAGLGRAVRDDQQVVFRYCFFAINYLSSFPERSENMGKKLRWFRMRSVSPILIVVAF